MNPEKRGILPNMAFRGFSSRYKRPELKEGFQDITEVAFRVCLSHAINITRELIDHDACSSMDPKQNVEYGLDTGPDLKITTGIDGLLLVVACCDS
jgi:hypothetical protein